MLMPAHSGQSTCVTAAGRAGHGYERAGAGYRPLGDECVLLSSDLLPMGAPPAASLGRGLRTRPLVLPPASWPPAPAALAPPAPPPGSVGAQSRVHALAAAGWPDALGLALPGSASLAPCQDGLGGLPFVGSRSAWGCPGMDPCWPLGTEAEGQLASLPFAGM